ncbi:hypothetical protein H8D76_00495 [Candidatus Bathyarchaeota archaeon]|nr:hypothetical protein [Candidatus Bathyarchaeota archaeon]
MPNVYVKSYGCSANTADAEIAKGILIEDGHTLVSTPEEADINIIVTCVVKTPQNRKSQGSSGNWRHLENPSSWRAACQSP